MKYYLLAAGLLLGPAAHAQKASDYKQFRELAFSLLPGPDQVPLYSSLKDTTARKPSAQLLRSKQVQVVGEYSPRWAVIYYGSSSYFIRQHDLAGLAPGQTVRQVAALIDAPLPLDPGTSLIDFSKVVQAPGASKDELYARGKVWFANTFKSAKDVIQADDKGAGILIGKGYTPVYLTSPLGMLMAMKLRYTIKLAFKEGRYKYEMTDFEYEEPATSYNPNPAPISAEQYTNATKKDGTPTNQAKLYAHALSQEAHNTTFDLERNMAKPSIGTDF